VTESVTEAGKISRNIQQALYDDAQAFFAGIDKLASAKSFSEAVEIQSSLLRSRGEVFVSRAKATADYVGQLAANSAKSAQDNFAKVYTKTA
jgi:phasin